MGGELPTNAPFFPPPTLLGATRIASAPRATPRAPRLCLPEYSYSCAPLNFLVGRRRRGVKPGTRDTGEEEKPGGNVSGEVGGRGWATQPEGIPECGLKQQGCQEGQRPGGGDRALHVLSAVDAPTQSAIYAPRALATVEGAARAGSQSRFPPPPGEVNAARGHQTEASRSSLQPLL